MAAASIEPIISDERIFILKNGKFIFRKKMAAFDYDHTLVKPKSKSTFSKGVDDWMWLRSGIPEKIVDYYKKGYAIVIFTNQSQKFKKDQIKIVMKELGIPCIAYICYDKSLKKPSPMLFNMHLGSKTLDMKQSFYVGDAAGRHSDWSNSDMMFAKNCGLKFYTPEEIFPFEKGVGVAMSTTETGKPSEKSIEKAEDKWIKEQVIPEKITKQELVIMVGYPGSGKSTYSEKHFGDLTSYVILQGDVLKTEAKIKKALLKSIEEGKSVVIDATNPSKEKRAVFIDIAKKKGLYIRVIHVATTIEESMMRNNDRSDETRVPRIVFYVYRKKFEQPELSEGIDSILVV